MHNKSEKFVDPWFFILLMLSKLSNIDDLRYHNLIFATFTVSDFNFLSTKTNDSNHLIATNMKYFSFCILSLQGLLF